MTAITTAGVYMFAPEHADDLQRLASDAAFAALIGTGHPPHDSAGADAVARAAAERVAGKAYWFAVVDRGGVKGVAAVIDPYGSAPHVTAWIEPMARRQGYGAFAMRMVLDFAFRNLQLAHVKAASPGDDAAAARTLERFGFSHEDGNRADTATRVARAESVLTRAAWIENRDAPALARLHPDLRVILDAELAAGNEVAETGGGWPDPDSVFVRLRDPFRAKPATLPDGVVYTEPNDPHWWKADYTTRSPRHTLAC